ncbi:MAG: hypothetical protein AAGF78_11985 [Pseudomonadota bacterium]
MQLNYDIDILPEARGTATVGQAAPAQVHYAAFRDPATAEAARRSSARTISILSDAGIALESYSSGAPDGHFPPRDENARDYLMACMTDALREGGGAEEDTAQGEFNLSDCLTALTEARVFGPPVPVEGSAAQKAPPRVLLAFSVLAIAGYMAGFAVLS